MECSYCKRIFANTSSLGKHQHTTKSCLIIQKRMGVDIIYKLPQCSFCYKTFTSKENSVKHYVSCKIKKKQNTKKNNELEEKVEQLSIELQNNKESINNELQLKDNKIKELEQQIKHVLIVKEKSDKEIDYKQMDDIYENLKKTNEELKNNIEKTNHQYQTLVVRHNSSLKNHRYIKFKESGPCFYLIEDGIPCECPLYQYRYKFGIAGISKKKEDSIDLRLQSHRTTWPKLKVLFLVFLKDAELLEKTIKLKYKKEINPNGHEIIEKVSYETIITNIKQILEILNIDEFQIISDDKIKEYNDYVITTVK